MRLRCGITLLAHETLRGSHLLSSYLVKSVLGSRGFGYFIYITCVNRYSIDMNISTKSFFKSVAFVFVAFLFVLAPMAVSEASVWVNSYYRSDGTYVRGHHRSEPNGLKYDNYSWSYGDSLYNDSYFDYGYDSTWYTPSYSWDYDYYTGYDYNNTYLESDFNNPFATSYSSIFSDYSYSGLYDYDYSW